MQLNAFDGIELAGVDVLGVDVDADADADADAAASLFLRRPPDP